MTSSPDPSSTKRDLWPCPVARSSMRQSDEGCSPDLFKTDQKKGVGYLLLIIQPSFSHDQARMHTMTFRHCRHNPSASHMIRPCKWARFKLKLVYRPLFLLAVVTQFSVPSPKLFSTFPNTPKESRPAVTVPISQSQSKHVQTAPIKSSVDAHGLSSHSGCSRIPLTSN